MSPMFGAVGKHLRVKVKSSAKRHCPPIQITGLRIPALTSSLPWIPYSASTQRIILLSGKFSYFFSRPTLSSLCFYGGKKGRPFLPSPSPLLHFYTPAFPTQPLEPRLDNVLCALPQKLLLVDCQGKEQLLSFPELHLPPNTCIPLSTHCLSIDSPFRGSDFLTVSSPMNKPSTSQPGAPQTNQESLSTAPNRYTQSAQPVHTKTDV